MNSPCDICSNNTRDKSKICVVEDVSDLWTFEKIGFYKGLYHVLGGSLSAIQGIGTDDIISTGVVSIIVVMGLLLKWHDLVLHSFDPTQVQTAGLSNNIIHYTLLAALTLTVVATLRTTGLILAIGLMIAPGAIAFLISKKFSTMLLASVSICIFSMLFGSYASFYLDSAPAPTVILVLTSIFVLAFICVQIKVRWWTRSKLQD